MTSRERILATIRHKQPDRVPVDIGCTPSTGLSAIAYDRVKRHLGTDGGATQVYDVVQQLAQPEDVFLDRFGADAVDLVRAFNVGASAWYDTVLPEGTRVQFPVWFRPVVQPDGRWDAFHADGTRIATMPVGATFFDQTCFPFLDGYPDDYRSLGDAMGKVSWAALSISPFDHAGDPHFWDTLRAKALGLRASSDRAIMVGAGCNLFEWGTFLRRIDKFLMDLAGDHSEVERFLDALMELHMATLEHICDAVGDVADLVRFGDDLGHDGGPFMSPATYRRHFKPRHKMLCEYVKSHSTMAPYLHSCGSIYRLLPDLIEAGFQVVNPVQTSCRDMEPERLKREFGKDITFWGGGCDTQTVLNRGTPQQVRDHVKERIDTFLPGGGFVFNTIHNILPDVPPENVVAMYEAVAAYS